MKMKKVHYVAIAALVMLTASMTSTGAFAAEKVLGFWFDTDTTSANGSRVLTLGSTPQSWYIYYTGSATISPAESVATLTGGYDGKIWKYECSANGTDWTTIGTLVTAFSGTPNSQGNSKTENGGPSLFVAKYLRLGYDVSLSSASQASASGSGSITATAVPEPSSLLVLSLGALPILCKRRKSTSSGGNHVN